MNGNARMAVLLGLLASGAAGQAGRDWWQRLPGASPEGRHEHAMAYDAARGRTVLFGGQGASGLLADTWEWDGDTWLAQQPASSPPGRRGHAMAFDASRGRIVLFGGLGGSGRLADTWEWDGMTWRQAQAAPGPSARRLHAMVFHGGPGRVVLFGGEGDAGPLADTWLWDGAAWTRSQPLFSPPARGSHAAAYDAKRDRTVLFGGRDGTKLLADTWEWDTLYWNWVLGAASPPAREGHALACDAGLGAVVLFGGAGASGFLADTWLWDGAAWRKDAPLVNPPARGRHAMAFDSKRAVTVLFGGDGGGFLADTWEFGTGTEARFGVYGLGCKGSHGKLPVLSHQGLPELDRSFSITLGEGPPARGSVLYLDAWPAAQDLGAYGAPGCTALVRPGFLVAWVAHVMPAGSWDPAPAFVLPGDPVLLGGRFYAQAFIHDPQANALGWITTNGLKGAIGRPRTPIPNAISERFKDASRLDRALSGAFWGGGSLRPGRLGDSGILGSLEVPSGVLILDTDNQPFPGSRTLTGAPVSVTDGVFRFDSIRVAAGAKLRFTGNNPARLLVRGAVVVAGAIEASGASPAPHDGSATQITGGPGAKGALGGGGGGRGGSRTLYGPVDGQPGADLAVPAGHPRASQAAGSGGKGSPANPAGADPNKITFNGFYGYYSQQVSGGGGGGSFYTLGTKGFSVVPETQYPQDIGPGGAAGGLFPLLPLDPFAPSSLQLLIGGAGGGGAGVHAAESPSFAAARWHPSAGGGAGGGGLHLQVGGDLEIAPGGSIQACGGAGGAGVIGSGAAPGGGGSGGSILLQVGGQATLAAAPGAVDARGGAGPTSLGGTVTWRSTGGNGGDGFLRIEHDPMLPHTALTGFSPAATPENTALLDETAPVTGATSLWYDPRLAQVSWLRFELKVREGSQVILYSDDPAIGRAPVLGATPVAFFLQGAVLDSGGVPTSTSAWTTRAADLNQATPLPLAVRFTVLLDTARLAPGQALEVLEAKIVVK